MLEIIRSRRGYTLIELMGVISIMGVLLALAVPSYHGQIKQDRLDLTAAQIASDIRSTQQLALAEESPQYKIAFYPAENKYTVCLGTKEIKTVIMPPGIKLKSTNFVDSTLRFSTRGISTVGGTITLACGERNKFVVVASVTGRVRVSDTYPNGDR